MYQIAPLQFPTNALEPFISEATLRRHRDIHHQTYVTQLNVALQRYPDLQDKTIEELLRMLPTLPVSTRQELGNLAGGHANHQFQWKVIGPSNGLPAGPLLAAIDQNFGSFEHFQSRFVDAAMAHVGSGWAFLSVPSLGASELEILVLPDNCSVLPIGKPGVLVCDLWEHAYDGQYPARRADYLDAFFHVVDWAVCGERYASFASGRMHPG